MVRTNKQWQPPPGWTPEGAAEFGRAFSAEVGVRLRQARVGCRMSLADVQAESRCRWTEGALGTYERGDRGLRVDLLAELSGFYGVPVGALLAAAERTVLVQRAA